MPVAKIKAKAKVHAKLTMKEKGAKELKKILAAAEANPIRAGAPEVIDLRNDLVATMADVMISFDTTGSMMPCLTQVRAGVEVLVKRLYRDNPNIRISIISHGDYCDNDRAITKMDFADASESEKVVKFIQTAPQTSGGDSPECYELVLHESRSASWRAGANKVLVLIGDDVPHGANYPGNTKRIDWRNELKLLLEAKINVYAVQALGNSHATPFYKEIAKTTGGFHLELDQFSHIQTLITAVCFKQQGDEALKAYEAEVVRDGKMNRSVDKFIGRLLHRDSSGRFTTAPDKLGAVSPSRFQVLDVLEDQDIMSFVRENGLIFAKGRGFYEFTKSVEVQAYKEVILVDRKTGDMFNGDKARDIAGIPIGEKIVTVKPTAPGLANYICFIQSTSINRKLIGGTKFLYETEAWKA